MDVMSKGNTTGKDEVDKLLPHILSKKCKHVSYGLMKLNKLFKKESNKASFIAKKGINRLVSVLNEFCLGQPGDDSSAVVTEPSVVELVLRCLVKLSVGNKTFREELERVNGLDLIEHILVQESKESVIKSACTLIAFLAEDKTVRPGTVTTLVDLLPRYEDNVCAVTILRTLWTICQDTSLISTVISAAAFQSVVKILASDQQRLVKSSLKVLHKFLKISQGEESVGLRVLQFDGLQFLLSLMHTSISDEENRLVSDCLYYMIEIPQVRISVCGTNFIEVCTSELSSEVSPERFKNAFLSLCLCAMEAMNRSRMRTSGALQKLVGLLGEPKYARFHFQIVRTFVCFLFDDPSLDVMLRSGLLSNLQLYLDWILKLRSENRLNDVPKVYLAQSYPLTSSEGSPGPASADGPFTNILGARGPFQDVMLILAKLSQTSAIRFMVTRSCIIPLLKYLSMSKKFDARSERILNRITQNPLFFELLLKLGMVQSIYFQLNTGFGVDELEKVVKETMTSTEDDNTLLSMNTTVVSFRKLFQSYIICIDGNQSKADDMVTDENNTGQFKGKKTDNDDAHGTNEEDAFERFEKRDLSSKTKLCAKSLLYNLSKHAESPFGQGVLTHGLRSDIDDIKEAFTVGFCYLCRPSWFQRKIFIHMKGLQFLLDNLSKDSADHIKLCNVLLAFTGLAHSSGVCLKDRETENDTDDLILGFDITRKFKSEGDEEFSATKRKRQRLDDDIKENDIIECCLFSPILCKYVSKKMSKKEAIPHLKHFQETKTSNDKQSACFFLENCAKIFLNREVISSKSPVFCAMLSNNFIDSTLPYVNLQDINATSFLLLLHHIHGCSIDLTSLKCKGKCYFNGRIELEEDKLEVAHHSAGNYRDDRIMHTELEEADEIPQYLDYGKENESNALKKDNNCGISLRTSCLSNSLSTEKRICLVTDILKISDRFMIDSLREKCEEYLLNSLTDKNVVALYVEGLSCQARRLCISCIKYMLVKMQTPAAYLIAAISLLKSAERNRYYRDLKTVLKSQIDV